jgi:hypothetical protein
MLHSVRSPNEPPQKEIELRVLSAARKAGVPIPTGEIVGEEPDFRFKTEFGDLGIELPEVLSPASTKEGITPVEQAAFYQDVLRMAQEQFTKEIGAAVRVAVHFGDRDASHTRRNKRKMARALFQCVRDNLTRTTDFVALYWPKVPEGFGSITITRQAEDWNCFQCAGVRFEDIRPQIASRISAKNELLPKYRSNLPEGAAIWLLLYTRPNVSRSVPVPHGIEDWKLPFEFDRVFWFVILGDEIVEIQREEPSNQAVA